MELLLEIIGWVVALPALLLTVLFLRAFTARLTTGKWPHESEASRRIFTDLP